MEKFLHHADKEISGILTHYPLPLFVLGPERVVGHFKAHSHHLKNIVASIYGNYVDAGEAELRDVVQPGLEIWRLRGRQQLLSLLQNAAGQKRLSVGSKEAAAAAHDNGGLLVVEDGFRFPELDALIGQVLQHGGDVEFIDDGALTAYDRIALIRYY